MLAKEIIEKTEKELQESSQIISKQLAKLPKGKLKCVREGNRIRFFNGRTGINRKPELVKALAEKGFLECKFELVQQNLSALKEFSKAYKDFSTEAIVEHLQTSTLPIPKEYLLPGSSLPSKGKTNININLQQDGGNIGLGHGDNNGGNNGGSQQGGNSNESLEICILKKGSQPQIVSNGPGTPWIIADLPFEYGIRELTREEMVAWANADYKMQDESKDSWSNEICRARNVPTLFGLMVRSKSEALVAETLHSLGVVFRYEPEIQLGKTILHPDFLILLPDGRVIILEHFGLLSNWSYPRSTCDKITYYMKWGFYPWDSFIASYENDLLGLDLEYIKFQLKRLGAIN